MSLHTFLQYPETKSKTLEEIDMMFQHKVPAWKTASFDITHLRPSEELMIDDTKHDLVHIE